MAKPAIRRAKPRGVNVDTVASDLFTKPGTQMALPSATARSPSRATSSADIHAKSGKFDSSPDVLEMLWNSVWVSPGHNAVTRMPEAREALRAGLDRDLLAPSNGQLSGVRGHPAFLDLLTLADVAKVDPSR